jgi:hypothetical protein
MANSPKAQRKYDEANTTRVYIKLNLKTDADIIGYLEAKDNKQGTIKELIRADIAKSQGK